MLPEIIVNDDYATGDILATPVPIRMKSRQTNRAKPVLYTV